MTHRVTESPSGVARARSSAAGYARCGSWSLPHQMALSVMVALPKVHFELDGDRRKIARGRYVFILV